MRATVAKPSAATVAFAVVALLSLLGSTWAYHPNLPYYGAGRRIAMSSIRTLTFYAGERTAYRRTEPLPQLKCVGSACSRYQPDVVQCQSMGDGQWKCAADLPTTLRLGGVEVSCEGYDYADDPYVLKDSCALTYTLLPAKTGPDDPWRTYRPKAASSMVDLLFKLIFWGILATIAYGFWQSIRGRPHAPGASTGGRGGSGGGGGGGGGWWPGGGFFPNNGPPPPYTPKSEPDSGWSSWRPGFWTGLGLGGLAAATAATRRRPTAHAQPTYFDEGPYGFRSPVAGPSTNRRGWESRSDSHDWHQSTGFGGTRNR